MKCRWTHKSLDKFALGQRSLKVTGRVWLWIERLMFSCSHWGEKSNVNELLLKFDENVRNGALHYRQFLVITWEGGGVPVDCAAVELLWLHACRWQLITTENNISTYGLATICQWIHHNFTLPCTKYTERQKKLIISSEYHSLKFKASTWIIFGHKLGKFVLNKHM